jgi:hypothetical protein
MFAGPLAELLHGLAEETAAHAVSIATCLHWKLSPSSPLTPGADLTAPPLKVWCTQSASHSSWDHTSDFVFGGGAFRDFVKGAFAPFFTGTLPDGLAAALPAAFLFSGFFGGMPTTSSSGLVNRGRRREGEMSQRWKGQMKEAEGGRNKCHGGREGSGGRSEIALCR